MSIEVVAIGNEVLRGMVVNTNGSYLGKRLEEEGWEVARQTTLPDDKAVLTAGLKECLERASIVIATGGLGPTLDDVTEECAVLLFSLPAASLKNPIGSAAGLYFKEGSRALFVLPGVPSEMEAMFEQEVVPILKKISPIKQKKYRTKLYFSMLREDEVDPVLRKLQDELHFEAGIYPSYGTLTIILRGHEKASLEKAHAILKTQFQSHYYDAETGHIEEAIQNWMIKHQNTMACAESCTGGSLAAHLTAVAGASNYFLGSLVAYSNALKEKLLQVSSKTLKAYGAVSAEAVAEMWKGVLHATGADFGVAISGIAGPSGGTDEKPVGTVHYAIGFKNRDPEIGVLHIKGNRAVVILKATRWILGLIWKQLH